MSAPSSAVPDPFEGLRVAFRTRLRGECVELAALSEAMEPGARDPAPVFRELRDRAHKIRGSAAIFEFAELAEAAFALELAAISASLSAAVGSQAAVRAALAVLVRSMGASGERVDTQ